MTYVQKGGAVSGSVRTGETTTMTKSMVARQGLFRAATAVAAPFAPGNGLATTSLEAAASTLARHTTSMLARHTPEVYARGASTTGSQHVHMPDYNSPTIPPPPLPPPPRPAVAIARGKWLPPVSWSLLLPGTGTKRGMPPPPLRRRQAARQTWAADLVSPTCRAWPP